MMNFQPEATPQGAPIVTCFETQGRCYAVDVEGTLFSIDTDGNNPDMWCWYVVCQL